MTWDFKISIGSLGESQILDLISCNAHKEDSTITHH